jgi:uncharacterized protein (TIGR02646 family)
VGSAGGTGRLETVIRVEPQTEPNDFDDRVRQPGQRALDQGIDPLPNYWTRCLNQLYDSHGGVCAYLSIWISRATGGRSVDHFKPKNAYRELAYEWSNYRLASTQMNSRKREFEDVLDPFEVQDGWFELEFMTLQIRPNRQTDSMVQSKVQATIDRLKLNDRESLLAREEYYEAYYDDGDDRLPFHRLERGCPLIAKELMRQAIVRPADDNLDCLPQPA